MIVHSDVWVHSAFITLQSPLYSWFEVSYHRDLLALKMILWTQNLIVDYNEEHNTNKFAWYWLFSSTQPEHIIEGIPHNPIFDAIFG